MSGADTSHSDYVGGLFRSHYDWLCGRLHRHLDSRAHAEDIAADTFVQLLTSPGLSESGEQAIRQPRALLTTIAQRLMYQLWRRRDLERAYLDALAQMPEHVAPSEEDRAIILQTLLELDQLLDGLPTLVKRAFLLAQLDGLTYAQISAELGISIATVKRHLTKAAMRCYFAL